MKDEKSFIGSLTDDKRHALTEALSNIDFSKAKLALESRASEHAAKSKLITDFLQFIKDFSLEKAVRGLILKVAEEKLQRDGLDKDDARYLTEARTQFLSSFDATMGWCETPKQRQSALTAILSASAIGSHGQDQKA
jgi:hypothetical protein